MNPPPRNEARGLALVVLSTVAFGVLPILGKTAYAAGVHPLPLLAWRYLIAAALLSLLARGEARPWRSRLRLWAIGAVFVFNSLAYFRALQTVSASAVALLLYSYPVLVALLAAAVGHERLSVRGVALAVTAFAGCALTAAGEGGASLSVLQAGPGVLFALLAALIYASYLVLSARFASDVPAHVLAQHLAQASALVCVGLAFASGGLDIPPTPTAWLSVLGIAVVSTVLALFTFLAGMAHLGPTRASVVSSLEVLVTLALAAALLDERMTPMQWAGAALILGAVAAQSFGGLRRLARASAARGTEPLL